MADEQKMEEETRFVISQEKAPAGRIGIPAGAAVTYNREELEEVLSKRMQSGVNVKLYHVFEVVRHVPIQMKMVIGDPQ